MPVAQLGLNSGTRRHARRGASATQESGEGLARSLGGSMPQMAAFEGARWQAETRLCLRQARILIKLRTAACAVVRLARFNGRMVSEATGSYQLIYGRHR